MHNSIDSYIEAIRMSNLISGRVDGCESKSNLKK